VDRALNEREPRDTLRRTLRRALDEGPTRVARVDPCDGACGVFRDASVLAQFTSPADPDTLSSETFRIEDHDGVVPARLRLSPDRVVLIWTAERLLKPGVEHVVHVRGVRDTLGQVIEPHESRFFPCDFVSTEWPP
jgi:hypothetical protein